MGCSVMTKFQIILSEPAVAAGDAVRGTLFFDVKKSQSIKSFELALTCMQHKYTLSLGPHPLAGAVNQKLPGGQFGIPFEFPIPETTFQSRPRAMNGISLKLDYVLECVVKTGIFSNLKATVPVTIVKSPEMAEMEHAYMMMLYGEGKAPWMPRHVAVQSYMKVDPQGPVFSHFGSHSAYSMHRAGLPPLTTYRRIGSSSTHFSASPYIRAGGLGSVF